MKSGYDARPIGIFDSGVGGLTVLRAIARRLPQERFLYLGDTARVPYGTKSARTVERYTTQVASLLLRRGVKALVVACNTASAMGLAALRAHCRTPVLGVIQPGCRAAVAALEEKTATGEGAAVGVGVIGTHSTVASGMYPHTLALLAPHIQITSLACPLFVPLVEEGWINRPATRLIVEESLQPLTNAGIGILILGCTHYPVLKPLIAAFMGSDVLLVDSAETVAEELERRIGPVIPPAPPEATGPLLEFLVTDAADRFREVASRFLDDLIVDQVEMVDL